MLQKYGEFYPKVHESCFIAPGGVLIGNVEMGKGSSVWYNAVIRADVARIVIGEKTNIQDLCSIHCDFGVDTIIGDSVSVGHSAVLHGCTIGDDCIIGMGAILLNGCKVGKECLVAAGSVVTPGTDIPEGSLVMGSPAKVKRLLTDEEKQQIRKNAGDYFNIAAETAESNK